MDISEQKSILAYRPRKQERINKSWVLGAELLDGDDKGDRDDAGSAQKDEADPNGVGGPTHLRRKVKGEDQNRKAVIKSCQHPLGPKSVQKSAPHDLSAQIEDGRDGADQGQEVVVGDERLPERLVKSVEECEGRHAESERQP